MTDTVKKLNQDQFCSLLEEAAQVVDLSDGGQLIRLEDGTVAHLSAMTGEAVLLPG